MPSLDELGTALQNAHQAGDVNAARILAEEIQKQQPAPSLASRIGSAVTAHPGMILPAGIAAYGMQQAGDLLDKAAYKFGGKVTDVTGSPELGGLANVATQAIPAFAGGLGGAAQAPAVERSAVNLMTRAIGPTFKQKMSGKAEAAARAMLGEGLNPSESGVNALKTGITSGDAQVNQLIANSPATVNAGVTPHVLSDVMKKFADSPKAELAAEEVAKAQATFEKLVAGQDQIPIQKAQALKQGYQKSVSDAGYGAIKTPAVETEKAIARRLREQISEAEPAVADINSKNAALINALKVVEPGVVKRPEFNPIGFGKSSLLGMAMLRHPIAQAMIARLLNAQSRAIPGAIGAGVVGTPASIYMDRPE